MKEITTVGVVGAGAMGRGIVQLFAQSGFSVVCYDSSADAVSSAIDHVVTMIDRSIDKGRLNPSVGAHVEKHLRSATTLDDLSECDVVIEAIIEDLSAKQTLFTALEDILPQDAILATNTSSLVVAEIASACRYPERVAGLHFFNPVPLMKVVEIIAAVRTDSLVIERLQKAVGRTEHRAVLTADQPGFLVNHAGRGLYTEGLRVVEEQVASPQDVDRILREAMGFKMGPFELMDLTGLDVSGKVMESIYQQFYQEPRFRPSTLVPARMCAGLFGRKSGEGWYGYHEGKKVEPQPVTHNPAVSGKIWVDDDADQRDELKRLVADSETEEACNASEADLILIQPWGQDASHYCVASKFDPSITVAVDPLPGLDRHRTLMLTSVTSEKARNLAYGLLISDGVPVTIINDSAGFVAQRVIATIVNIAANIVQRGIATVEDLDDAVRIGLGYPKGPLALGDAIGPDRILSILKQQQAITGDDRYRPSLWLSRRALLQCSLLHKEAPRS